jgi:hypothetical protein
MREMVSVRWSNQILLPAEYGRRFAGNAGTSKAVGGKYGSPVEWKGSHGDRDCTVCEIREELARRLFTV